MASGAPLASHPSSQVHGWALMRGGHAMASAVATRDFHPSKRSRTTRKTGATPPSPPRQRVVIPREDASIELDVAPGRTVTLTNLHKPFWPELGITKGDLLQFYADISPVL